MVESRTRRQAPAYAMYEGQGAQRAYKRPTVTTDVEGEAKPPQDVSNATGRPSDRGATHETGRTPATATGRSHSKDEAGSNAPPH